MSDSDDKVFRPGLSIKIILCTFGLFLGMSAAGTHAAPATAVTQSAPHLGDAIQDLGLMPPPPDADTATPASSSTVSSAEPVPELPIWAMLLVCFAGIGVAKFKRGRKDRLSPGLE